jgi:hypothetical protein
VHDFASDFIGIISEEVIDEACFIASQSSLPDLAQKKFAVPEEYPSILEAPLIIACVDLFFGCEVDYHSGSAIWPEDCTDDLLSSPKECGFENGGWREVDEFVSVCEP